MQQIIKFSALNFKFTPDFAENFKCSAGNMKFGVRKIEPYNIVFILQNKLR